MPGGALASSWPMSMSPRWASTRGSAGPRTFFLTGSKPPY